MLLFHCHLFLVLIRVCHLLRCRRNSAAGTSRFPCQRPILLPAQGCYLTSNDYAGRPNLLNFIPVLFSLHTFFARKICLKTQMDSLRSCGEAVVVRSLLTLRIEQSPNTSAIESDCSCSFHLQHSFHSVHHFLRNFWMFELQQHRPSSYYFPLSCQACRPSS